MSSSSRADTPLVIHSRIFTTQDQVWFAACSGDFNPIHLDSVMARRELPGAVVVHGAHLLLWSLDAYGAILARRGVRGVRFAQLQCSFRNPVYLDIPVEVHVVSEGAASAKLAVVQDGQIACKCSIAWEATTSRPQTSVVPPLQKPWNRQAVDVAFDELSGKQGSTPVQVAAEELHGHFDGLTDMVGLAWVAELMAISRIVGMESPGLHSMLSSMDLVAQPEVTSTSLCYTVEEADPRMGLVTMRLAGAAVKGTVSAFYRPGVVSQMSYNQVKAVVRAEEFKDQRALVIGGSRGIGEAAAKLVAAGGGEVWLTYHTGEEDARSVCQDIVQGGGRCRFSSYRVGAGDEGLDLIGGAAFTPTQVYYFATPRVTRARRSTFSKASFMAYSDVYVAGFAELHAACTKRWPHPIAFFFPSSVAVQEHTKDLLEYCSAKAVGEALCAFLNANHPMHQIQMVRLPVVATELSRGLIEASSANAVETMLPIVRSMQAGR